jgi:hypothetical protein
MTTEQALANLYDAAHLAPLSADQHELTRKYVEV